MVSAVGRWGEVGRQVGSHLGFAFFHRLDDALRHVRGRQPAGGVGSVEVCHCVEAPAGCRGGVIPRRRHGRQGRAAPARYGSCLILSTKPALDLDLPNKGISVGERRGEA